MKLDFEPYIEMNSARQLRMPPMPSLSDLVKLFKLTAQRQLGQNYLLDKNMNAKLIQIAGVKENCMQITKNNNHIIWSSIAEKLLNNNNLLYYDTSFCIRSGPRTWGSNKSMY